MLKTKICIKKRNGTKSDAFKLTQSTDTDAFFLVDKFAKLFGRDSSNK